MDKVLTEADKAAIKLLGEVRRKKDIANRKAAIGWSEDKKDVENMNSFLEAEKRLINLDCASDISLLVKISYYTSMLGAEIASSNTDEHKLLSSLSPYVQERLFDAALNQEASA